MKPIHSLFFFTGICAVIVGAFFKIEHWVGGDILLLTGLALEAAGLGFLLYQLTQVAD